MFQDSLIPVLNNTVSIVYEWGAYLTRFIVVFWFLIFPCCFVFTLVFIRELNRHKSVVVVFNLLKDFRPYSYFFHNLLLVFILGAAVFNTLFFLYSLIDAYIINLGTLYRMTWAVTRPLQGGGSLDDKRKSFFWGIVFVGYILHSVNFLYYTYYNLYFTNSYFAEIYREFIIRRSTTSRKLMSFKDKHPRFYEWINRWFLDVSSISRTIENQKIITLD